MSEEPSAAVGSQALAVLRLVVIFAVALVTVLIVTSYLIWNRSFLILWVPAWIWAWSFAGGMVAVLYRLGSPRLSKPAGLQLYSWAISTPLIGLFFGAIVYFVALAGAKLLNQAPIDTPAAESLGNATWLNVIAFFGGFRADLSVRWVRSFVGGRVGDGRGEEDEETQA